MSIQYPSHRSADTNNRASASFDTDTWDKSDGSGTLRIGTEDKNNTASASSIASSDQALLPERTYVAKPNSSTRTHAEMEQHNDTGKAPMPVNGSSASGNRGEDPIVKVQPPRREDLQPSYARVIKPDSNEDDKHGWYGSMINSLGAVIGTLGAIPPCICCPNPYKEVGQGNVGLVTKFGRFSRAVDPGLVKINPLSERLISVDVKIQIVGMLLLLLHDELSGTVN